MLRRTTLAAALVAAIAFIAPARQAAAPAAPELLRSLPAGDAVATVDVATLLDKTLPAVLANRPESRQKLDANIARVKADYGVDLRQVRTAAVSASPYGGQLRWVAALDGRFEGLTQPQALARAAEQFAARYPTYAPKAETHEGTTLYVLTRTGGAPGDAVAFAVLDATTALYGSPDGVRGAIGARKGTAPSAASRADLVEAYQQADAGAVIRFATILPEEAVRQSGNDPFLKSLAAIQFVFGTAGADAERGLAMRTTARTGSADDARSVHATLTAVVDLGRQIAGSRPEIAALVDLVSVTTAGNDVQLLFAVPPDKLDPLFRAIDKESRTLARQ